MNGLEILLNERFILKHKDRKKYYKIKDEIEEYRSFIVEKLGCNIIINPILIKLEKIPYDGESYMGIKEFDYKLEYVFLCQLLIFLEDKDVLEQFVLSELTEFIETNIKEEKIDWTLFGNRRKLVKVLKFAVDNQLLDVDDGSEESFVSDHTGEVLYQNTGASKYFMRTFTKDIREYNNINDFEGSEWMDSDELKGQIRRNRVYKKLLFSPGMFRCKEMKEDFDYLKNKRNNIEENFQKYLDIRIDLNRSSAYMVLSEYSLLGKAYPKNNMISDIVLLFNGILYKMIKSGEVKTNKEELIILTNNEVSKIVDIVKEKYIKGFNKTYRMMTHNELKNNILNELESLGFIEVDDEIKIFPIIAKIIGEYPEKFLKSEV